MLFIAIFQNVYYWHISHEGINNMFGFIYKYFKAWLLRIVRIGNFYDIPTSGILPTSGNTSSQKSQTVGIFYDVIGRIGIISTLKVLSQTSQTSAIFTMSVNLAILRIAIVVRIPVSGNRKNPRFLRFLGPRVDRYVYFSSPIFVYEIN